MHRREKTAASRMDVRSAAGLGRGSHRSSHTPAPPHKEAQARREIPPSPPQVGLSRTASAGGSTVGEEVQGFPAPVWILMQNEVPRRHGVRGPGLQHPRKTTQADDELRRHRPDVRHSHVYTFRLAQRHVPPRDRVITASRPYPMATKVAHSAPPKSWALRATWGC